MEKACPWMRRWRGLPSVAFDAVFVPGGAASIKALSTDGVALHYLLEAYKHLKAIALARRGEAVAGCVEAGG
jgi:catalase